MSSFKVALLIETSREYGRSLLRGINRYSQEDSDWTTHLNLQAQIGTIPNMLENWDGDGVLAQITTQKMADLVLATGLPFIDLRGFIKSSKLPVFSFDNTAIAKLATEHFLQCGIRQFAFLGPFPGRHDYLDARGACFSSYVISKYSFHCHLYAHPRKKMNFENRQKHLVEWLKLLPKPTGILAFSDEGGHRLLDLCLQIGISVPAEIQIIGVDNDPLLCSLTNPSLTSIDLNGEHIGYDAASYLAELIRVKKRRAHGRSYYSGSVRVRGSTGMVDLENSRVTHLLRLIHEQACSPVSIEELLLQVPVARSQLFKKFKLFIGHSPKSELTRVRIESAKTLLESSDYSLDEVAYKCGFNDPKYFSQVFRKIVNISPSRYMKKNRYFQIASKTA